MLHAITILALALVAATTATDNPGPSVYWCWDKCTDFEALVRPCIHDKGCVLLNGGIFKENSRKCVVECRAIVDPCQKACHDAYTTCRTECPNDVPWESDDCFENCFGKELADTKPPLPKSNPK